MNLIINGEPYLFCENGNISNLLSVLEIEPKSVAIERNLSIVPKSQWDSTYLCEGDKIEIVQFVGGG